MKLTSERWRDTLYAHVRVPPAAPRSVVQASSDNSVAELLLRWREGEANAQDTSVPFLNGELRWIARKSAAQSHNAMNGNG